MSGKTGRLIITIWLLFKFWGYLATYDAGLEVTAIPCACGEWRRSNKEPCRLCVNGGYALNLRSTYLNINARFT